MRPRTGIMWHLKIKWAMTEKFLSRDELLLLSARGQPKEDLEGREVDNQSLFLYVNNWKTFNTLGFNAFVWISNRCSGRPQCLSLSMEHIHIMYLVAVFIHSSVLNYSLLSQQACNRSAAHVHGKREAALRATLCCSLLFPVLSVQKPKRTRRNCLNAPAIHYWR